MLCLFLKVTCIFTISHIGDVVVLFVMHWTCNLLVAGSSPDWAPLCSGLRQATYTRVPLSKQHNLVSAKGSDLFGWESNRWPGGK